MTSEGGPSLRIASARRVLLCMGPGGVGKTTVSAAIGLAAARAGRKVIVVTIDPSRRLAQALGLGEDRRPGEIVDVAAGPGVRLQCLLLDTRSVFDHLVHTHSRDAASAEAMLANPIYQATARHLSGAVEYAATARVHMLVAEGAHDLVVLDTPPTANAVEFLEAPRRIREVIENPAARVLAGTGRIGMKILGLGGGVLVKTLESMGGGGFLAQLGGFLRDFGSVLGEFRRRAGDVEELLTSRDTGTVLTTAPTDYSVREAEGFLADLYERRMNVDGIVLNRVLPSPPADPGVAALLGATGSAPTGRAAHAAEELHALAATAAAQSRRAERILAELRAKHPEVPVLPIVRRDPPPTSLDELQELGSTLLGV
jgi:anion-transporting  ArsA/GET3 family ATPase